MERKTAIAVFFLLMFTISALSLYINPLVALPAVSVAETSALSQSLAIGPESDTFHSNRNYLVEDNGTRIQDFVVTLHLTGPLVGTSSPSQILGNWSFQINGYSPPGYIAAYMQWVVGCYVAGNKTLGLYLAVQYNAQNDRVVFVGTGSRSIDNANFGAFTAGSDISIGVNTNSTGNVAGVSARVVEANGTVVYSDSVDIAKMAPTFLTPVVGLEAQLIGDGNADFATFTKANGTITYQSSTPLGWTAAFPGTFPWIQYKNIGTVEHSNISYSEPASIVITTTAVSTNTTISTTTATLTATSTATSNGSPAATSSATSTSTTETAPPVTFTATFVSTSTTTTTSTATSISVSTSTVAGPSMGISKEAFFAVVVLAIVTMAAATALAIKGRRPG